MHWKTYQKLTATDEEAALRWDAAMIDFIVKLENRKR